MSSESPGSDGRLLVIRLSALGDVLHTAPAVVALSRSLAGSKMAWVVEEAYQELAREIANVDVIPVKMKRWGRAPFSPENVRQFRAARTAVRGFARGEWSVDFQGLLKSAIWGLVAGAGTRWGFDASSIREKGALLMINRRVEVDPSLHVIEQNMALASAIAGASLPIPELDFSRFAGARKPETTGPIVLIPGTGRREKNWSPEGFAQLGRHLIARGAEVLVVWGPGEEELAGEVAEGSGARLAPPTDLRELGSLLAAAPLVVGGDTGPLHMAAAMGRPVVGLYGPTDPGRNGPWGRKVAVVSSWGADRAMSSISTSSVIESIDALLSGLST